MEALLMIGGPFTGSAFAFFYQCVEACHMDLFCIHKVAPCQEIRIKCQAFFLSRGVCQGPKGQGVHKIKLFPFKGLNRFVLKVNTL